MKKVSYFLLLVLLCLISIEYVNAGEVKCEYVVPENVAHHTVSLDGTGKVNSSGPFTENAISGNKITITIGDVSTGQKFDTLEHVPSISVEADGKLEIYNKTNYDIGRVSKGKAFERYNALRQCPDRINIVYTIKGTGSNQKFVVYNILLDEGGANLNRYLNPFKSNYCTTNSYTQCYYVDATDGADYTTFWTALRGVGNRNINMTSSFALGSKNSGKSVKYNQDNSLINSFKCGTGEYQSYQCPKTLYYTFTKTSDGKYNGTIKPNPSKYEKQYNTNLRKLELKTAYQTLGTEYIYDTTLNKTNRTDNSEYNPAASDPTSPDNNSAVVSICKQNPDDPLCKSFCDNNPDMDICKQLSYATHIFHFCEDKGILKTLKVVHNIINIAMILVPIILIIIGSVEFGKATMEGNDDAIAKATSSLVKKLVIGLIIFFVPVIVNSAVSFAQSDKDKEDIKTGDFMKCAACFTGKDSCNSYINGATD